MKSDHYKFVKAHRNDLARAINGKNLKNDDSFSHFIKMYVDAKKENGEEVQPDQIIQVYKAYVNYANTHNRNC